MRNKSSVFYSRLARHYDRYSLKKKKYNDAVDKIIMDEARFLMPKSLLDVGCGNGKRTLNIVSRLAISDVVLLEPSCEMLKYLPANIKDSIVINNNFIENAHLNRKFGLVLMLWNVLGHIDFENRVKALRNIGELLDDNGELYLDFNNRYNISAYKLPTVLRNIFKDLFHPRSSNGDVDFTLNIDGEKIEGSGHVFNPREVEKLINDAGLKIKRRFIINYENGNTEKSIFSGQLLYKVTK